MSKRPTILPLLKNTSVKDALETLDKTVLAQAQALQACEAAFNDISEAVEAHDLDAIRTSLREVNAKVEAALGEAPDLH